MSDKSDLKAELERKKQRLAQIRQEKKIKEEERKKKESEIQQKRESIPEDSDLDLPTPLSPSKSLSTPSETGSQDSTDGGAVGSFYKLDFTKRTLQWDTDPSVLQLQADSELGRRMQRLGASKITQVDFLPKEMVAYCKETQTPLNSHLSEVEEEEEDEEMMEAKPGPESEQQDEDDNRENKEGSFPVLRELTEEERQQILHSSDFQSFFDCSIRVMERALAEDGNIFFDYSGRDLEDKEGDLGSGSSLSFSRVFYDEHWSKHRVITCLDWSPQYPELLVASYNNNEDAPHEPDGVALVWNMKFKKATPEYIYHCQSPVVSVGFAKFHPNLVVGGTYSGQIVLWDNRSHRRTPVQRTPLSAAAHTHPVYCVNVVGTQNANNLITVSTDGRMCSWSLDMLSQPQETMELVYNKSKPVAVTGMAFPTGDVNNYVVGSEEGTVYTASRHGRLVHRHTHTKAKKSSHIFAGSLLYVYILYWPVTGVSCHSAVGTVDFSHLFITSSFDWTVKLWSTKTAVVLRLQYTLWRGPPFHLSQRFYGSAPRLRQRTLSEARSLPLSIPSRPLSLSFLSISSHNKPLYSFEDNADYVYDVMWSPVHPAVFAAVDGMGRLDLWNLNNDTEVPTASVTIEGASALNRVRWSSGGKEVAVGDSEGRVWIYDTGELSVTHTDDWSRFARTLMEIRANRADGEEEGPMELDS
ncbi:hypothetical protein F7725_024947 [Dissostichus mawsoni]|uniref:Dynein cytoplasmic 1 intermediate chain 1 n=2 Tax=Nototheniidae TaxID=8206 RepID=A0A7J5XA92_DISMA|nr:hypothetical protein F7725_024947 [Dissostichus mawsoni]